MLTCLAESLLMLGALVLLAFLLPARLLRDVFVPRGTALGLTLIGVALSFWLRFAADGPSVSGWVLLWALAGLLLSPGRFFHSFRACLRVDRVAGRPVHRFFVPPPAVVTGRTADCAHSEYIVGRRVYSHSP